MIKVFEAMGQATNLFDDQVDGFGPPLETPEVSK
jgi:hypothetical protein